MPTLRTGAAAPASAAWALRAATAAFVAALAPAGASAQASPWYLGAALGLQHDSNLYRLGDGSGANLPADRSKSDTATTVSLLAGLDQPLGRHRLHGDASLRDQRYADNAMLDNQGWGASGGFDWSAPERLSGAINLQSHRNLARFDTDAGGSQHLDRNIERVTEADTVVRVGLVTRYSAELGYNHRAVDYSAAAYATRAYRQGTTSAGLRYRPSAALTLGLGWRHTRAVLPNYYAAADSADRSRRNDLDFSATWQASGASELAARLSSSRTRYERFAQRDWSGLTGQMSWLWRPTGKLNSTLAAVRDDGRNADFLSLGIFGALLSDQSRTTSALQWRLGYELSAKLQLSAGLRRAHRVLENTLRAGQDELSTARGADDATDTSLGLRWQPLRSTQLSCEATQQRRSASGGLSLPLHAHTFGCQAQVLMQ